MRISDWSSDVCSSDLARLARNMGLTRQSVQRVVNEMVDDGMLCLLDNPHHVRARLVTMTAKGRKTFEAALELQEPWVKALSAGIGRDSINDACQVLNTMRARQTGRETCRESGCEHG